MIWVKYWPWWRQLGVWLQQTGFYLVCQKVTVQPVASSTPTKCEISCTEQLVHYNEEIISLWQIVTLWHTCFFNIETYSEKEDLSAFPLHCYHSWHFTINTRWVHGSATTRAVSSWKSRTPKQWCLRRGKNPINSPPRAASVNAAWLGMCSLHMAAFFWICSPWNDSSL